MPIARRRVARSRIIAVLEATEGALVDLDACNDPRCTDSACLHALPQLRQLLADLRSASAPAST